MANKNVEPQALAKAFTDNWDYIRDNIISQAPDIYQQIYGVLPGTGPAPQSGNTPTPTLVKNDDGTVSLDQNTQAQLQTEIIGILQDTKADDKTKLKKMAEAEFRIHKAAGGAPTEKEAEENAKEYMRQWRQQQRAISDTTKTK